jgi:hypothetical protein
MLLFFVRHALKSAMPVLTNAHITMQIIANGVQKRAENVPTNVVPWRRCTHEKGPNVLTIFSKHS